MNDNDYLMKGALGVTSQIAAITVSFSAVEQWLRIASLGTGLLVGVVTLVQLLRNVKK